MAHQAKHPINPKKFARRRTICEVIRRIYRAAEKRGDAETMDLSNEAHDYAKRMAYKLQEYAGKGNKEFTMFVYGREKGDL